MRPQHRGGKPFSMPPPQQTPSGSVGGSGQAVNNANSKLTPAQFAPVGGPPTKRDIIFPPESVEATMPVLYRRKRICRAELGTTDPWRVFMCLQSGLLSESTWALDVLNILLFDDSSVQYFGLSHLPRLLTLLLDHFQKSLADMFDPEGDKTGYGWSSCTITAASKNTTTDSVVKQCRHHLHKNQNNEVVDEDNNDDEKAFEYELLNKNHNINHNNNNNHGDYDKPPVDLGQVTDTPNPDDRVLVLATTANYTFSSRRGVPVKIKEADDDIFVLDTKRIWDVETDRQYQLGSCVGGDAWTYGHTQPHPHDHIIDSFRAEIVNIPFARYIRSNTKCSAKTKTAASRKKCPSGESEPTIKVESTEAMDTASPIVKCEPTTVDNDDSKLGDKRNAISYKDETTSDDDSISTVATPVANKLTSSAQPMDSDCREVDMELERITNGPQSNDVDDNTTTDDDCRSTSQRSTNSRHQPHHRSNRYSTTISGSVKKFDYRATVHDPAGTLKRKRIHDYEDECYARDEASLYLINESQDTLARRCISISNILRNLTFVPGNESIFANSETFLAIVGKILLLHHDHPVRTQKTRNYDREDDTDFADSCSSLQGESEWWWEYLIQLRENMMVAVANIAGHMQLAKYDELITRPCLDGLLHWAVCPSAHGQDPFPSCSPNALLSPQRLALEALCKLCVTDANVDLVIATPPFTRLEKLCSVLTRHLCRNEDQVLREFSVNLLHYLAAADSAMARTVAMQSPCISYLVAFIEQAEQTALGVANQHGINYLRENPDSMGTSLDMLRRTAGTLLHLARHPDNRPLFLQQEPRLLGLVMSHILDQQVALIISRVLFQVSRGVGPMTMAEMKQPKMFTVTTSVSATLMCNIPSPSCGVSAPPTVAAPSATLAIPSPASPSATVTPASPPPTLASSSSQSAMLTEPQTADTITTATVSS